MAQSSLFGTVETEGQARVHSIAAQGLAGAISGPGAVPAMLIAGAADLFGRIIPNIIRGSSDPTFENYALMSIGERMIAATPTRASLEENRARNPGFGYLTYPDGSVYDMFTGAQVQAGDPNYAPPLVGPPTDTAVYDPVPEGEMGWINTSLSGLGGFLGGLGEFVTPLMSMASETAPLWGLAAPKAASVFGVGSLAAPTAPTAVPTGWQEVDSEGGDAVASIPTTYLPGVTPASGGIPGYDLMVPEAQRIEAIEGASRKRMPSSATIPYKVNGRTKYAFYRNMGRPVLYAGDFAACRRVKRAGSKARRYSGGR